MARWVEVVGGLLLASLVTAHVSAQPLPALRIVYEGDTRGASSGGAQRSLAQQVFREAVDDGAEVAIRASDLGALYQDGRYLLPAGDGEHLSDVLAVLDGSPIERVATTEVPVLRDRYSINLLEPYARLGGEEPAQQLTELVDRELAEAPDRFADVVREDWTLSRVRNSAGAEALLLQSPRVEATGALSGERSAWEVRFRYDFAMAWPAGQASSLITVERRIGEGTRRLRWARQQLEGPVPALFVSAGNSVEGRSWIEGQALNLQRPTTWSALHAVGLDLLVPAQSELAGGVANLRGEAASAGIQLISANLFAEGGTVPLLEGAAVRVIGGLRVAFVGLTDPDVTDTLPPGVISEIDVVGPDDALAAEIARLRASPDGPPDLIVLLTLLDRPSLDTLLDRVPGVDLVISKGSARPQRDSDVTVRVPAGGAPSEVDLSARGPLIYAQTGAEVVGFVDVLSDGKAVSQVHLERRVVDQTWEPLSPFINSINTVRHELYAAGERILFPDLNAFVRDDPELVEVYLSHASIPPGTTAESYLQRYPILFSQGIWLHYLANMLRSWTGADVALVRVLRQQFTLSGPIPRVLVDSAVGVLDEVVVYRLSGADLVELLEVRDTLRRYPQRLGADDPPPAVSGAAWDDDEEDEDERRYLIGGRQIDPEARYTVALTDQLAAQPDYAAVLVDYEPRGSFTRDLEARELVRTSEGRAQRLHGLVIADLEARAEAHPDFGPQYVAALVPMLAYQGHQLMRELAFRIRELDFVIQQVSSQGERSGYQAVRNTRVTQPDSISLGYVGDLDLIYDLVTVILTLTFESEYGQVNIEGDKSEIADDLVGLLDLQVRAGDPVRARSIRPYVTIRYDTEFTPVEVEDAAGLVTTLDRQSLLRNSAGVRFDFSDVVPELRLGLFSELDLATEQGGNTFGAELLLRQELDLDPVKQRLEVEGLYYFARDDDTEEDLRFSIKSRLEIGVPLLGNLELATFVDAFVFQGTESTNDNVAVSLIFGAGLSYHDIFRWAL